MSQDALSRAFTIGHTPLLPKQALPPVQCEFPKDTEAAVLLGISVATMRRWRLLGKPPRAVKLGSSVRYRRADLLEWAGTQPMCGGQS